MQPSLFARIARSARACCVSGACLIEIEELSTMSIPAAAAQITRRYASYYVISCYLTSTTTESFQRKTLGLNRATRLSVPHIGRVTNDGNKRGLRTGKTDTFANKGERDSAVAALDGWTEVRARCAVVTTAVFSYKKVNMNVRRDLAF